MRRAALPILVPLLCLLSPAWGQGAPEPAVAEWVERLGDPDPDVRRAAAVSLRRLGPGAAPAVPALARALRDDPDEWVCDAAAKALSEVGAPAVPALIEALREADRPEVRLASAVALSQQEAVAARAVPALIDALEDDAEPVRRQAAKGLARIGAAAKEQGQLMGWVIPRVFWRRGLALLAAVSGWLLALSRFPRRRPRGRARRAALVVGGALVPTAWCGGAIMFTITQPARWPFSYLPDSPEFVVLPPEASVSLSLFALFLLISFALTVRKPEAAPGPESAASAVEAVEGAGPEGPARPQ